VENQKYAEMVGNLSKCGNEITGSLNKEKSHAWHMATGIAGECLELLECAYKFENTGIFDSENAIEELGDIYFYVTGLANTYDELSVKIKPSLVDGDMQRVLNIFTEVSICGGEILDIVKKHCIYEKKIDFARLQEFIDKLLVSMLKVYNLVGVSHDEVIQHNVHKLLSGENARYATGSYSNEQAQDRADKMAEQG